MTAIEQSVRTRPPKDQIDLIAGRWSPPTEALVTSIDDPNTGSFRQVQAATSRPDVERALSAAAELHTTGTFARVPLTERAHLLDEIAAGLTRRAEEIAYEDAMATGNPLRVTTQMTSYLPPRVTAARDQLLELGESSTLPADGRDVRLLRRPLGTAVVLAPWNAPTFVAVAKVASALAAGCPVVLKPSEWAPAGCQIVSEVIGESLAALDLPLAAFQLIHGGAAVGAQVASDPRTRAISFTGGGAGGRAVAAAAAPHFTALHLELGGHNPAVIRPDADIELAAAAVAKGMTKLNGQWCEAPGKILVPKQLHGAFVDVLVGELRKLRVGHCLDEITDVGPLAYSAHRDRLRQQVAELVDRGGQALSPCDLPDLDGWFFSLLSSSDCQPTGPSTSCSGR